MSNILKRRILFCIDTLTSGGAEKYLITLLKKINYNLYDVDLCILHKRGVYFDDVPSEVNYFFYADAVLFEYADYDIEIAFLEGNSTKVIGSRLNRAYKIAWVHTDLYANHWTKAIYSSETEESLYYNMINKIVFVSKQSKSQFEKLLPSVHTTKQVIYNTPDTQSVLQKSQINIPEKKKLTLCSIGRLIPLKGYERLIPILSKLKKEELDFHFWIIGEGYLMNVLYHLIDQYELNDTVFLKGFQKNPYSWLNASDIFVSVSFTEGLPLVVSEAICLHKPILATNVTGIEELLANGRYGMIVDSNDNAIYSGLKEMITNNGLRDEYAKRVVFKSKKIVSNEQEMFDKINKLFNCTSLQKHPLDSIACQLITDNFDNSPGLLYGKMGKAIFFFHYAQYSKNEMYENYAIELIEDIQSVLSENTPVCYESGLAGIGAGIEYLIQNNLVKGHADEILESFDFKLLEEIHTQNIPDYTLLRGYIGCARYWMFRFLGRKHNQSKTGAMIQSALDHVLYNIESDLTDVLPDNEKIDILLFLLNVKQLPKYTSQIDRILSEYDLMKNAFIPLHYFHKTKENIIIQKNIFNKAGLSYNSEYEKIHFDHNSKSCLLNGIISTSLLYMLQSTKQSLSWIELV